MTDSKHDPKGQKPRNAKNFTLAFLIVGLVMVGGQAINLVITFLPAAAETLVQVDGETTVTVASLRNAYLSSVMLIALVYGLVLLGVHKAKNWARWIAVTLAVLSAAGGVNGLAQTLAAGSFDMVALAMSLAQLVAAGWVLTLAFRKDVEVWFKSNTRPKKS